MGDEITSRLERAIFDTVRYFDIFHMPVTATQVWRSLVVDSGRAGMRWHGQHLLSLAQVRQSLVASQWLGRHVVSKWGYYCLRRSAAKAGGAGRYVQLRLKRHVLAQSKWRIARRVVRLLALLPLVRMMGVTGSLALSNTRPASDLDLFVVVRSGRIWTARLLLLLITQLTGRRRKYWDREAPDKICLNHYITDDALLMSPDIRSCYTAVLYAHLVPVMGMSQYHLWLQANASWLKRWLMYPYAPLLPSRHTIQVGAGWRYVKRWLEALLLEPVGDVLEHWAERVQRRTIARHTYPGRSGRVAISDTELAFHPDSQESAILGRLAEEYGQKSLL